MKVLIVEDKPERVRFLFDLYSFQETKFCDTVDGALEILGSEWFDLLLLDFDLREEKKGSDIARYVAKVNSEMLVVVHSDNRTGAESILKILDTAILLPITAQVGNDVICAQLKAFLSRPLSIEDVPAFEKLLRRLASRC